MRDVAPGIRSDIPLGQRPIPFCVCHAPAALLRADQTPPSQNQHETSHRELYPGLMP